MDNVATNPGIAPSNEVVNSLLKQLPPVDIDEEFDSPDEKEGSKSDWLLTDAERDRLFALLLEVCGAVWTTLISRRMRLGDSHASFTGTVSHTCSPRLPPPSVHAAGPAPCAAWAACAG